MRSIKFLGFAAGMALAASSSVIAQTGPTFPTTPPVMGTGSAGDATIGSGSSADPRNPVEPGKTRAGTADGMSVILPGTDPAAGR
jgi:hypothetical protein